MKWIKSKFQGVRYREHPSNKHGVKPDRYYTIFYKLSGKMIQEALGWASKSWEEIDQQGNKRCINWTEKRAAAVLAELKKKPEHRSRSEHTQRKKSSTTKSFPRKTS